MLLTDFKYCMRFTAISALSAILVGCGSGESSSGRSGSSSSDDTDGVNNSDLYSRQALVTDLGTKISADYQQVKAEFEQLNTATTTYCDNPTDAAKFDATKQAWRDEMDSWQKVQFINFGPAQENSRRFYIQLYPLNSTLTEDRIQTLIEAGDSVISQSVIADKSADMQGLPALEHVLFLNDALTTAFSGEYATRYCDFIQAVSANLVANIEPVARVWQLDGNYYTEFSASTNVEQSLEDLFGAMGENLEIIKDKKLKLAASGNYDSIESPVAQHSLENIATNIHYFDSLVSLSDTRGIGHYLEVNNHLATHTALMGAITTLKNQLAAEERSISTMVNLQNGIETLQVLATNVGALQNVFVGDVAHDMDVFIGFNSSDGD